MKIEFMTRRQYNTIAAQAAVGSILTELTYLHPDMTITFKDSDGPFSTWSVHGGNLNATQLIHEIHDLLNDYTGDDPQPRWNGGQHHFRNRRYMIARTRVRP